MRLRPLIFFLIVFIIGVSFIPSKKAEPYFGMTDASLSDLSSYKINDYDVQYHDSVDVIMKREDITMNYIHLPDQTGNIISLPRTPVQGSITYYEPGAYTFGASSYVPSYEDSVLLSRTLR